VYQHNLIELLEEEILLLEHLIGILYISSLFFLFEIYLNRMAPEVIACDENPQATYDNRVVFFIHLFSDKMLELFV